MNYMRGHESQIGVQTLSRQAFLKIFLDLVDKGFLKSENDTDVLSINNKIGLSFNMRSLADALEQKKHELNLPNAIQTWIDAKN